MYKYISQILLIGFLTKNVLTGRSNKDFINFANNVNHALTDSVFLQDYLQDEGNKICAKAIVEMLIGNQAIHYVDAIGKPGSGLSQGNFYMLGSYEECKMIDGAQYCIMPNVEVKLITIMPAVLGICAPQNCNVDSIKNILNVTSQIIPQHLNISTNKRFNEVYGADAFCYKNDNEITYETGAIVMIVVCSILAFLCFLGTVIEIIQNFRYGYSHQNYTPQIDDGAINNLRLNITMPGAEFDPEVHPVTNFVLCFSLIKNTRAIFNTDVPDGIINSANGIRTISMSWIILGHVWSVSASYLDNTPSLISWGKRFSAQAVLNSHLAIDTFFLLSGLMVGYLTLRKLELNGKLPFVRFYLHRLLRLTPSYAFVIFFYTYLYPLLSDGPFWYTQHPKGGIARRACRKFWWTNLLYINNFYPAEETIGCLRWGWYLANDMQFYLISPPILWCFYRFQWIGISLVSFVLVLPAYFLSNGFLIKHYHGNPLFDYSQDVAQRFDSNNYINYVYNKPYTRISPYLVGLILGYVIHKYRLSGREQLTFSIKKIMFYFLGWMAASFFAMLIVYVRYSSIETAWNDSDNVAYGLTFRLVWSLAVAWVIYACYNGYGGIVNSFLSWKAFVPLGRLTYSTYLVHVLVIYLYFGSLRTPFHLTEVTFTYLYVGMTLVSFMVAFIVTACIEYPVLNLEKFISASLTIGENSR